MTSPDQPDIEALVALARSHYRLAAGADESEILRALLTDPHVVALLERQARHKKSRKQDQSGSKHPPAELIELAMAFDQFVAEQREEAHRRALPVPALEKLRARFLKNFSNRFPWLSGSGETLARLCREGRRCASWPRVEIDGEIRIVAPDQAAALKLRWPGAPLAGGMLVAAEPSEIQKLRAEVAALRADRRDDPERMGELRAEIEALASLQICQILGHMRLLRWAGAFKEIPDEIQNSFASSDPLPQHSKSTET